MYHHVYFDECIYVITCTGLNDSLRIIFLARLPPYRFDRSLLVDLGRWHGLHHVLDKSHHPSRPTPDRSQESERAGNDHLCTFTLEDLTCNFRSDSWGREHLSGRFLDSFFLISGHVGFDEQGVDDSDMHIGGCVPSSKLFSETCTSAIECWTWKWRTSWENDSLSVKEIKAVLQAE